MRIDHEALGEARASMFSGNFHDALERYRVALGVVDDDVRALCLSGRTQKDVEWQAIVELAAMYHLVSIQEFARNGIKGVGIRYAEKSLEINRGTVALEVCDRPGEEFLRVGASDPFVYLATFYLRRGLCVSAVDHHDTGTYDRKALFDDIVSFFCLALEGFARDDGMTTGGVEFVREYAEIVLGSPAAEDGSGPPAPPPEEVVRKEGLVRAPSPEGAPIASAAEFVRSRYAPLVFRHMRDAGFPLEADTPEASGPFLALVDDLFYRPLEGGEAGAPDPRRERAGRAKKRRKAARESRRRNRAR